MSNVITKWTKTHTLATLAIVAVGGYLLYNKYIKDTNKQLAAATPVVPSTSSFTGNPAANNEFVHVRYSNASGNEPARTY